MIQTLKDTMKERKFTGKQLAKALDMSTYKFSRMLGNKTKMDIKTYESAMKVLGYRAIFVKESQLK